MRTADAVHAHGLQSGEFAVQGVFVEGRSQTAEVVVLADTVDLEVLAIEPETCLRVETERAETCGGLVAINDLAVLPYFGDDLIDMRLLARPWQGLAHRDARRQALGSSHNPSLRVEKRVSHQRDGPVSGMLERHVNVYLSLTLGHLGIGTDAPVGNVGLGSFREPYMTVDAAAAVPTGVGLV